MTDAFGVSKASTSDKVAAGALAAGGAGAGLGASSAIYNQRKEASYALKAKAAAKSGQPYHGLMAQSLRSRGFKFGSSRAAMGSGVVALAGGGVLAGNKIRGKKRLEAMDETTIDKAFRIFPKKIMWGRDVARQKARNSGAAANVRIRTAAGRPPVIAPRKPWYRKGSNQALMGLGVAGVGGGALIGASSAKKKQQQTTTQV